MSKAGKRVIVCGGRDFQDWHFLTEALNRIHKETPIEFLFHGNAKGADDLADGWGRITDGVRVHPCPAKWAQHGKAAGPKRNQAMLGHSIDFVVAFPGGRGTADMVKRANAAGVPVVFAASRVLNPEARTLADANSNHAVQS